ncbi:hypothetical protein TNIN_286831 [Trichonephila inaurata madagascariensis]|uniref:Uncharacterized protein n=1 Tax=Trichonephila inaurata madagascariensis TaxID=2747483 RepID=A0A8X6Y7V1_9ARAC|nr:hypothetical protein TNIN_254791 [Trichonephila inaurata madagascariensis]GFY73485.1 hypothetical protein TNIN_286831 [Trichonephila inaurata madagascariensis]
MMPSTSGYNLRPRGGAKVKSRSANEKRTQQGGPVRSSRSRGKKQYSPTPKSKEDQAAGIPEEEVSNNIARRGQEEQSVTNPSHLKS